MLSLPLITDASNGISVLFIIVGPINIPGNFIYDAVPGKA